MTAVIASATHCPVRRIPGVPTTTISDLDDTRVAAPACQCLTRDHGIVESDDPVADHLVLLVPLSRDDDEVARPCELDSSGDCLAPIDKADNLRRAFAAQLGRQSATNFLNDAIG